MSALKSFLLNVPALSHSYSCGFNGSETSWLGKWDSISSATPQAINHRQQLLQPSLLWLQTLTSWNNILLGVASLDGSQLLASWWKEDKIYYRPCRIWIKPNHIVLKLWDHRMCHYGFFLCRSAQDPGWNQSDGKSISMSQPASCCQWFLKAACGIRLTFEVDSNLL